MKSDGHPCRSDAKENVQGHSDATCKFTVSSLGSSFLNSSAINHHYVCGSELV
jgi:hypothetical protein